MKKILFLILILSFLILSNIADAQISHYYEINLKYNRGDITLNSIQVKPLIDQKDLENIEGSYIAEVNSFDDEVLNLTFFNIPTFILYDSIDEETGEINGGGMIELNETEVIIKIPYFENAEEIKVYDINISNKLTIDVSDYAKNSVKKNQNIAEAQQKKEEQKTQTAPESKEDYTWYLLSLLVLVIIIMVFLYRKHAKIK